ncbi:lysophospholipid acyltransferase family protein [Methylobrevis pamukkalensis]|uniref:Lipid A biosynthesis lauroyl acyltransferase n=1 Tax=Methylobrevis pamukkalensis TaxID=1439726 RepID=A0A1E3H488_9HYPH|nr:hypothetical protein [Methylobrevis pamukkalensis]ODN71124.1 lipid A biosynthesis lauroyl acyltransferase [Methylobrevis pamukkalensis]
MRDTLADLPGVLSYNGLKLLPPAAASATGAWFYGLVGRFSPGRSRRVRANVARIRPDLDPDAAVRRYWRNKGRLMSEFSVLRRIPPAGRLQVEGAEHLLDARSKGPVIILGLHLGNWELLLHVVPRLGIPASTFYMPPDSRAQHRIARRVRLSLGTGLIDPGVKGVRPALRLLADDSQAVMIFGDEGFGGRIMAPFFGRPVHLAGNLAIAVRLARHSGATIVPAFVERTDGCRFVCRFLAPVAVTTHGDPADDLPADVARLNRVVEPLIQDRIEQWYFLDHRL